MLADDSRSEEVMKYDISLSHVALLVPSVEKAAAYLRTFKFDIGDLSEFESEGNREIYVEFEKCNSLLLLEPLKDGPYQQALKKRGPGLHHIAIDVLNIEDFILSISGSGWLLHPVSLKTLKDSKTAYLAKPGFPSLIEVQEKKSLKKGSHFVSQINIQMNEKNLHLAKFVGLESLFCCNAKSQNSVELVLDSQTVLLNNLI